MVVKYFHRSVDLVNSVNKRITSNELIRKKDRVLLSVSGGQDSICLMFLLNHLYAQMELHLALFWCHHLWQFDSFSLMRQIAKLSFLFQLNSYFAISPNFIPSELLARHWRHNCSYRICFFYNYYKLSLAHSANDKVETIFLNLIRGTGLAGLFPLRWTQLVSKKCVQNEEHISQFSNLIESIKKKAIPCYYFQYAHLRRTDKALLHRASITVDMQKICFLFTLLLQCECIAGVCYSITSPLLFLFDIHKSPGHKLVLPSHFLQSGLIACDSPSYSVLPKSWGCFASIPSISYPFGVMEGMVGSTVTFGLLPIPLRGLRSWVCSRKKQRDLSPPDALRGSRLYKGVFALQDPKESLAKPLVSNTLAHLSAVSQEPYSSFSDTLRNRKQECSYILKTTKAVVLKKKPQQKLKFKKRSKKITAKKWFCYVSYTFLKVCL